MFKYIMSVPKRIKMLFIGTVGCLFMFLSMIVSCIVLDIDKIEQESLKMRDLILKARQEN